ncbi:hypothetical protein SS50377_27003 [Spironucleus salmonicida]|nr:hypothetical protein SS50377_27003 [Spironucleus salmonicida]
MQKGKIDKTALSRPPYNSVEPKIKIQPYLIQPPRPRTTKPRFYRLREAPNPEIIFEDEFTDPMYRDYLDRIKMQVGGGLLDGNQSSLAKQRQMLRPVTSIAKALRCQVDIGELNVEVYKFK